MLKIAICDDMVAELKELYELTNEYLRERCVEAQVRDFNHPDHLLTACEKESFHIFLLDMVMPMISGLEVGRNIRRMTTDAQIVYITTEPGFALDAYSVNPLHYLLKPVDKNQLFDVLDLAVKKVDFGGEGVVTVKTKNGLCTISKDNILCCEYIHHRVIYTLTGGKQLETASIRDSFSTHIAPLLEDKRFISPHASFAINMSFVEKLDKSGFILRGGIFVPISGRNYSSVRNNYMSYRLGEV